MAGRLEGKVMLVAGSSSGMGRAVALLAAEEGARVGLLARRKDELARTADGVEGKGGQAIVLPCDVRDTPGVQAAIAELLRQYGRLDILVNCAGVNNERRWFSNGTQESWDEVVDTNLTGAYALTQACLPHMRAQRDGVIIHIASMAAKHVGLLAGVAYTASKTGLDVMVAAINVEERRNGIRACAICPGEVNTPLLDKRPYPPPAETRAAMLQPEDIAETVVWIASRPPRVTINEVLINPTQPRSMRPEELAGIPGS